MAHETSFERAAKHPLRITIEGTKAPERFVNGWNDALTISLSIQAPPAEASAWYPREYKDGWNSCRSLLLVISHGKEAPAHVELGQAAISETARALFG